MEDLINNYIKHLLKKNLAPNTIESYSRDLKKYNEFLKTRDEKIEYADNVTIMAFIQSLLKNKASISSTNRNIVVIRNFYKYLYENGYIEEFKIINYEIPKINRELPEILTIEEVDKFLSMPDTSTEKGIRDRAMLELLYATGMKVTELINLRIFDVNLKMNYIRCIGAKNKERIIPLGSYAVQCLQKYFQSRQMYAPSENTFLFLNSRGNKMTRQGFWKIVKGYAEEANIKKDVNLNTFRHSFAVHLLENGADIRSVQELLGYTDLAAAQIYLKISKKSKLAEVYKNAHPRA